MAYQSKKQFQPLVLWFTGLSGAGKTTLAMAVHQELKARGIPSVVMDGDILRQGLCQDLAFSPEDRTENIRRAAEVCKITSNAGMITLAAFISPLKADRSMAKVIVGSEIFREIYVNASLATCISRDVKGLYKKAISGEVKNFTGISALYEPPESPFMGLSTDEETIDVCVKKIISSIV